MRGFVIAVDGPAASGKGTIAGGLARSFGLPHLDTGLLYRAVALRVLASGGDLDRPADAAEAARDLDIADLDPVLLTTAEAGASASRVAVHAAVREALMRLQRDFAGRPEGAVLDGRDIGTVIAPGAAAKLYVTASPEVRAERRWRQASAAGEPISLQTMLADIRRRDERDAEREAAPMVKADDAVLLDTTAMDISTAADEARRIVQAAHDRWERSRSVNPPR